MHRFALALPLVLIACVKADNLAFPPLTTPSAAAPAPAPMPEGFSPMPGVVLSEPEAEAYKKLTDAQRAVVDPYLRAGSTLASALQDEAFTGQ